MSSSAFTYSELSPSRLSFPPFHSTDVVPMLLLVLGMAVAFLGFRLSRLFCFITGLVLGMYAVDTLFLSQSELRHAALPLIVISLVSLVAGVTLLLLHELTLSAMLGYVLALFVMAADNGRLLGWGVGRWLAVIAAPIAVYAAGRKHLVSVADSASSLPSTPGRVSVNTDRVRCVAAVAALRLC